MKDRLTILNLRSHSLDFFSVTKEELFRQKIEVDRLLSECYRKRKSRAKIYIYRYSSSQWRYFLIISLFSDYWTIFNQKLYRACINGIWCSNNIKAYFSENPFYCLNMPARFFSSFKYLSHHCEIHFLSKETYLNEKSLKSWTVDIRVKWKNVRLNCHIQ